MGRKCYNPPEFPKHDVSFDNNTVSRPTTKSKKALRMSLNWPLLFQGAKW